MGIAVSPSNHRLEREQALTGQLGGQNPAEPHRHMLTKMHAIHTHTHTHTHSTQQVPEALVCEETL